MTWPKVVEPKKNYCQLTHIALMFFSVRCACVVNRNDSVGGLGRCEQAWIKPMGLQVAASILPDSSFLTASGTMKVRLI